MSSFSCDEKSLRSFVCFLCWAFKPFNELCGNRCFLLVSDLLLDLLKSVWIDSFGQLIQITKIPNAIS